MVLRAPDFKSFKHWEYRLRGTRAFPTAGESHSTRYHDDRYEYKHVTLTREQYGLYRDELLRNGGQVLNEDFIIGKLRVRQTPGWEHYYIYPPNPQLLCLRRPLNASATNERSGSYLVRGQSIGTVRGN